MGRHGGGSRSGGSRSRSSSSRSRSGSGSRSGGSSGIKKSTTPFYGCYNRTYYDRKGRMHKVYTNSASYGTKKGYDSGTIIALAFITIHMLLMIGSFSLTIFDFGGKVDGDASRILIEDNSNLLDASQEKEVLKLFNEVYEKTGMPITLYTTDFSWKNNYYSIEIYSEELYYKMGMDEDAMIILFTSEDVDGFWDWEYDMYCGDDTIKCLSDNEFEKLLNNFQKSMSQEDLAYALEYSWRSIIDDIGEQFKINFEMLPILGFLLVFYGIFYFAILSGVREKNTIYKYFKENPDKLSMTPMTLYSECPNCGASNVTQTENCTYCGSLLKIEDGKIKFVNPN